MILKLSPPTLNVAATGEAELKAKGGRVVFPWEFLPLFTPLGFLTLNYGMFAS